MHEEIIQNDWFRLSSNIENHAIDATLINFSVDECCANSPRELSKTCSRSTEVTVTNTSLLNVIEAGILLKQAWLIYEIRGSRPSADHVAAHMLFLVIATVSFSVMRKILVVVRFTLLQD